MCRLLDVLREELRLTGVKEGCGEGECGACAVLVDGVMVNSCLIPVLQVDGAEITTVEGVAEDENYGGLCGAFIEHGATQCGICTPGMLVAAIHLLRENPDPSREQIRQALAGNLCRCTGYQKIVDCIAQMCRLKKAA
jgi:carbon-monoxide dehydrogenase small subunit